MRHRTPVLGELSGTQSADSFDTENRAAIHIRAEFLILCASVCVCVCVCVCVRVCVCVCV